MVASKLEMQIKLDLQEVMKGLNAVNVKLNELFGVTSETITIDADTSGAVAGADEVEGAIDEVPDNKDVIFDSNADDIVGQVAKLGLAVEAVSRAYQMASGAVGELLGLSNEQEIAEQSLVSALEVKGQATQQEISRLKDYASAIQKVTTVGDEQTLGLLTLATNMGIVQEKREEALRGSIGLAEAYAKAGLSQETAMKGIALAYEGDFNQLQRYIPALKTAKDETEKMAILQEAMANGFEMAKDKTKTGAGAMVQFSNQVGDLKEKLGDMIKGVLLPLVKVLNSIVSFMNDYPRLTKSVIAGISAIAGWIVYLKVQQVALNTAQAVGAALMGNWVGLATAASIGIGVWAMSSKEMTDKQSDLNSKLVEGTEELKDYNEEIKVFNENALKASKAKNLDEIDQLEKLIEEAQEERQRMKDDPSQDSFIPSKNAEIRRLIAERDALIANNQDIENEIKTHYQNKKEAQETYYEWKKRADETAKLDEVGLIRQRLAEAEKEYDAIGELDKDNIERKKEVYTQVLELRKQLADKEKAIEVASINQNKQNLNEEKMSLIQYYADISQLSTVSIEQMKEDFEKYLAKVADTYGAESEEYQKAKDELTSIEKSANMKLIQEKGAFTAKVAGMSKDGVDREIEERNNLLKELKKHYAEGSAEYEKYLAIINQATIESAEKRYQDDVWPYDAQMQAVNDFFDKKHDALIVSGMEEERIAQLRADALVQIEEEKNQRQLALASGFFGNMATVAEGFGKDGFMAWKRMAQAQALVDTYASAVSAFKSLAGIPIVGPALGTAAAAAAIVSGLANVKRIEATKYNKAEKGGLTGLLAGPSHSNGGILIEAEGDEYITRKQRVKELGVNFMDFINNAPLEAIKRSFSGLSMPNLPAPVSAPSFAYASGGQVSSNSNSMIDSLISEVKLLRQELKNKKMTVINKISANEVLEYGDDEIFSEKSEKGDIVRSVTR